MKEVAGRVFETAVLELCSSVRVLGLLGVKIANRREVITFQSIFEIELGGGFQVSISSTFLRTNFSYEWRFGSFF